MNIVKKCIMETKNARFHITISEVVGGKGLLAEYYGTTPKFAQIKIPGRDIPVIEELGSDTFEGEDVDDLLGKCRIEINKIDGEIVLEKDV